MPVEIIMVMVHVVRQDFPMDLIWMDLIRRVDLEALGKGGDAWESHIFYDNTFYHVGGESYAFEDY